MVARSFLGTFVRAPRLVAAAAALLAALATAAAADAATALVRWLPPGSAGVTGYAVYVRNAGATYGSTPAWTGNPTPAGDGSMSATVTYTPAASGTNYFAVVAVASGTESNLSQERAIGPTNPCRDDTCVSKTSCTFGNRADGTPCDDGSFCNGPEICRSGTCDTTPTRNCADAIECTIDTCSEDLRQCIHTGPPGCCLACDVTDPCLADACAAGDCTAPEGIELQVGRLKFMKKAGTIKLVGKARFELETAVNPSETGAVLELRSSGGTVLYSSTVDASLLTTGAAKGRYRYTASRVASMQQSNGLNRLDFRVKGSRWLVTVMIDAPTLADAAELPEVTVMLRLGDACMRRIEAPCNLKPHLSICR